ncbi:MAG: glycosyl transferase family 36, partial [Candidatus Sericytochromatia bacterium]|nr:glycosyl transferase family 36 [Candidatus Sericytochromatia bacterium]
MRFATSYGHFRDDGREYVITRPDTPQPWVNVISNGDYGMVLSQAGGGFSWRSHSNMNRLTRWTQDLIKDEQGRFIYLRDEADGEFWSATWQPTQHAAEDFKCRHGLGYTTFEQTHRGIASSLTMFAARTDACEIWLLTLTNTSDRSRTLTATTYLEWNLGAAPDNHREFHKLFIETTFDPAVRSLIATKRLWEVPTDRGHWNTDWPYVAFLGCSDSVASFEGDKSAFVGRHRGMHRPFAMEQTALGNHSGRYGDAIGSLRVPVELAPGASHTVVFVLGAADTQDQARTWLQSYGNVDGAKAALQDVETGWNDRLAGATVETPDPAFDTMVNVWLRYQAISCHLWAKAAYFQQSGALGFRDQLQTSQIWLPLDPPRMREQLVLHARHQYQAGNVLHWWHPLTDEGHATDMTDDLLWLPFMTTAYLKETLDWGLLDEVVPYVDGESGTYREHCERAIALVLSRFSPRGLPLIGAGDWCDGFSAVGIDWKGESIWLGHFLYKLLVDWAEIIGERLPTNTDKLLATEWLDRAAGLRAAVNEHGWEHDRYICATTDDGSLMGSATNTDNQIYLNSQTWSVLSGIADEFRARTAMSTAHRLLETPNGMQLLWPAYHTPDRGIGYITRYSPGSRENGGVYMHAATWAIMANAQLGNTVAAYRLFNQLNPISSANRDMERYAAEPYVLPGNIDGTDSPNVGRAGWTWYTGAAGWLHTIALNTICGLQ